MKVPFVDLKAQYESIKEEIDAAISEVITSTSFIGGDIISKFEEEFASYLGVNHCVACGNGSDAIEIALKTLNVGIGDEVLVPAITWIATAGAVKNVGATPVFLDVLDDEYTLNPDLLEDKITDDTKAIIPVHLYGMPCRMPEILAVARKHDLFVIEDCAQAHGAEIEGKKVGSFGDISTFSFYPGKNLGAYGDAGAMVTNVEAWVEKLKRLRNHGQIEKHDHAIIGRNSRLDTMQAAILRAKLPHLSSWVDDRRRLAQNYSKSLESYKPTTDRSGFKHAYHLYVIRSTERDALMASLKSNDIGCAIHYPKGLPFLEIFGGAKEEDFPITARVTKEILSIPLYPEMTDEQQEVVINHLTV